VKNSRRERSRVGSEVRKASQHSLGAGRVVDVAHWQAPAEEVSEFHDAQMKCWAEM